MTAEWFYEIDGQSYGPVTAGQLKQQAVSGKLQPAHLIWKKGLPRKVPARSVKGLFEAAAATPSPANKGPAGAAARPSKPVASAEDEGDAVLVEEFVEVDAVEEVAEAAPPAVNHGHKKLASPTGAPSRAIAAAAGLAGKPFRVMSAGKLSGPLSLAEIRHLLASGKLPAGAMVGLETWLPVAAFRELLGSGPTPGAAAISPAAAARAVEQEPMEVVEAVEVVEEAVQTAPRAKAPPKGLDEDLIPVDEEFRID